MFGYLLYKIGSKWHWNNIKIEHSKISKLIKEILKFNSRMQYEIADRVVFDLIAHIIHIESGVLLNIVYFNT